MPHLSVSNKSPIREVVFGRLATLVVYARPFTDLSQSTKIHEYIQLLCEEESWKNSPYMETNTNCTTQGCPEYYLFKKSKSTSPSPPKKEKESAKTKRPVLLDLFDVQSFCMIFFTIIIDIC